MLQENPALANELHSLVNTVTIGAGARVEQLAAFEYRPEDNLLQLQHELEMQTYYRAAT